MPKKSRTYKEINRCLGKAIDRYQMIDKDDRILIGLSGGKDSLALAWFLKERLQRIPVDYKLFAVYVDPGFDHRYGERLADFCHARFALDLAIIRTDNGVMAHSAQNRENPCFLCAKLRRKALFELAEKLQCNKVALGHHKDDLIETLLINMFYAGQISTMLPSQTFFNGRFQLIRPLILTPESRIGKWHRENDYPKFKNVCPSSDHSKRQEIKVLLDQLYKKNPKIRGNLFRAMHRVNLDYLPG